jgi:hypothetical protein
VATVLLVCLTAGAAYAGYDQARGEIKSIDVDGGRLVLAVRTGRDTPAKDVTYIINDDTSVQINREKKTLKDLAEGTRANVVFREAEKDGGEPTALLITVYERRRRGNRGGGDVN